MFSILLHCDVEDEERLTAELWELGTVGIAEEAGCLRAFFDDDPSPGALLERFIALSPEFRAEEQTNWEQVARDAWPPVEVGKRFFLIPPWRDDPAPPGRLRLEVHPGMACGTGRHPATRLALEALERYVKAGSMLVDVGAGSGILTAAAQLLGAFQTIACDIDAEAVCIARQRVHADFYVGSADAIRSKVADVVVANINSETIERLRSEFERITRPGGVMILSGFEQGDEPEGFEPYEILRLDGWVCLIVVVR